MTSAHKREALQCHYMSNRQISVILILSCFALAFPRLHKTFITDRGRPYMDTPFVILPGIIKSSQPIGDDPNLSMALNLTYKFVRYSYVARPPSVHVPPRYLVDVEGLFSWEDVSSFIHESHQKRRLEEDHQLKKTRRHMKIPIMSYSVHLFND